MPLKANKFCSPAWWLESGLNCAQDKTDTMNLTYQGEEAVQYLVQMKLADSARPKSPEDTIAFIKQYVFPTLDVCDKLLEEKKFVAGGPLGGAIAIAVVVTAESAEELDDILESLPVWPLMHTTVTPLTTFAGRRDAGRRRLEGEVQRAGG